MVIGIRQEFGIEVFAVAVRVRPVGGVARCVHHGKEFVHGVIHDGQRVFVFAQSAVVDPHNGPQRIQRAVVDHLCPEGLAHIVGALTGQAAPGDGLGQRLEGRGVQAVKIAQQHRIGVHRHFAGVGVQALEAGDDAGGADLLLVEILPVFPVIAPRCV